MQESSGAVAAVREFNRFYTNVIGLLRGKYLDSPYSLTEARLLFEMGRHDVSEVPGLRRVVDIDAGYLSRILARFESDSLITRQRSEADARRQVITVTPAGRAAISYLDSSAAEQTGQLLGHLSGDDQRRLLDAMRAITEILEDSAEPRGYLLREPRPGDMGWVVQRNAEVYAAEFGWDQTYEALVARIVADYVDSKDAKREAAWIAEVGGARAGCVFCVRENDTTARLRLLLVDPWARGLGIGGRLVDEVLRFARAAGYTSITLWTNDILASARRIYQRAGFTLDNESPHHSFGHDLTGQNWSRPLVLPVPQTAAYACWRPHADPAWTYRCKTGSVVETVRMLSRLSGLRAWRSGIPDRHARTNAGTSGAGPGGPSGHNSHTTRTGGTGGSLRYRRRGSRRRSGKPG